jgi:sec-independent protein translocase protein TatA
LTILECFDILSIIIIIDKGRSPMLGGGIGMPELLVVLVIVLVIFGAGKLPEIGKGLGKGIRNFRKATSGMDEIDVSPKEDENELENKEKKPD